MMTNVWLRSVVVLLIATAGFHAGNVAPSLAQDLTREETLRRQFEAEDQALTKERARLADWKQKLQTRTGDLAARIQQFNLNPKNASERAALASAKAALNDDINRYNKQHDAYVARKDRLRESIDQRVAEVEKARERTRAAIERTRERLGEPAKAIDEWAKLEEEARQHMERKGWSTLVTFLLTLKQMHVDTDLAEREKFLNKLKDRLTRGDFPEQNRKAAEGAVAFFKRRLDEARLKGHELKEFLEDLDRVNVSASIGGQLAMKHRDYAEVFVEFLHLYPLPPNLKLVVVEADVWVPIVTWAGTRTAAMLAMRDLTNWSESQLTEVRNYSRMMVRETDELRRLRATQKRLAIPD